MSRVFSRPLEKTGVIAWTGHRPFLFADPAAARSTVESAAGEVVAQEPHAGFLVGGQLGVDTWAAFAAIALQVPFKLVLPLTVREFAAGWSEEDRAALETTVAAAAEVVIVGGDPLQAHSARNRVLATQAGLLIAVWTGIQGGGTAETIAFARSAGTPIREFLLEPSAEAESFRGRGI